ncbi:MAG: C40 family peptidase [Mycobacteriales bacterium]
MSVVRAVAVATATLWTSSQAPRPIDLPSLGVPSEVREWAGQLLAPERLDLHGRVESQALLGDSVLVEEERDGWARVAVPTQPSSKEPAGYPGWIPSAQLIEWDRPSTDAAVVKVPTTVLHESPAGSPAVIDVSFATTLPTAGPAQAGWQPVHLPGRPDPAWIAQADVDVGPRTVASARGLLQAADQFRGLPYLWGGTCGLGLDCSGLVHLVFRRFGITVPRDAHDQAAAAPRQMAPDEAIEGDLLFFAKPGQEIHHVGIATGPGRMMHAPETGRGVSEEALSANRLKQLVSAGRWG